MNGVEEAEDEICSLQDRVRYLEELVSDLAEERLFDVALSVLRSFRERPFQNLAEETYHWPYAGPKHEASFASEVFYVFKKDIRRGSQYRREFAAAAAKQTCGALSSTEARLLEEACFPKGKDTVTLAELGQAVVDAVIAKMEMIVREYDTDILLDRAERECRASDSA
jgi:hypothetical protein